MPHSHSNLHTVLQVFKHPRPISHLQTERATLPPASAAAAVTILSLHPQPGTLPANQQTAVLSRALAANIRITSVLDCLPQAAGANVTIPAFARYTHTG